MANISSSARYIMVATKNKWEEQGFHFDDGLPNYGLEQFVYNRLNELGWFRLARQPARANYNWVLEFYTSNSAGKGYLPRFSAEAEKEFQQGSRLNQNILLSSPA
ncbi:hypothetical protein V6N13_001987 [Hibiscus sabdariffa]